VLHADESGFPNTTDQKKAMVPTLSRYLNKTVLVSIPALFEDGTGRPYTLLGAEMNGLWLQSDALTDRLLRDESRDLAKMNPAVFVPFAQIAGVLIATSMPAPSADEHDALQPPERSPATRSDTRERPTESTTPAPPKRSKKR
jgi:hypothetical protein